MKLYFRLTLNTLILFSALLLVSACNFTGPKTLKIRRPGDSSSLRSYCGFPAVIDYQKNIQPILTQNCFSCHMGSNQQGGFSIPNYADNQGALLDTARWDKILEKTKSGAMPPGPTKLSQCDTGIIEEWLDPTPVSSTTPTPKPSNSPSTSPTPSMSPSPSSSPGCQLPAAPTYETNIRGIFSTYCFSCHSNSLASGGVNFQQFTTNATALASRAVFDRSLTRIMASTMPPSGTGPTACEVATMQKWLGVAPSPSPTPSASPSPTPSPVCQIPAVPVYETNVRGIFSNYCMSCHSNTMPSSGVNFEQYTSGEMALAARTVFDRAVARISLKTMPPAGPGPSACELMTIQTWLGSGVSPSPTPTSTPPPISPYSCQSYAMDPGRVTLHRLNNTEYNNTVRDLLGTTLQPAKDFPSDSSGIGFDNNADILSITPLLMENYISAAEAITGNVLPPGAGNPASIQHFDYTQMTATAGGADSASWNLYSNGEIYKSVSVASAGSYKLRANVAGQQAGPDKVQMALKINDVATPTITVSNASPTFQSYEVTVTLTAGSHKIAAAFLNDYYSGGADRNMLVKYLELEGPVGGTAGPAFLTCVPAGADVTTCAKQVLSPLAQKAYRRPVSTTEVDRLVALVSNAIAEGDTFQIGIGNAIEALLLSPDFLFRVELDTDPNNPNVVKSLNPYELASRLSYFLWSTLPDTELFARAQDGTLTTDAVLSAQVTRMLASVKSRALVDNFASPWLYLRKFDLVKPDPTLFPSFTLALRQAMRTETELYFQAMKDENRSVADFADSNFSYLNDALAAHYGISGVSGSSFRKVILPDTQRGGVLTHASIMTATSNPDDTAPVKRGKWMLSEILCSAPPPPPANVDSLAGTVDPNAPKRTQLAQHRANPSCAGCHAVMDPIGLGFENFSPIGQWRTLDRGMTIDPSGTLPPSTYFANNAELRGIIKSNPNLPNCIAEKVATYALGRLLASNDQCMIGNMTAQTATTGNRFNDIIQQIVKSDLFRKRRGEAP